MRGRSTRQEVRSAPMADDDAPPIGRARQHLRIVLAGAFLLVVLAAAGGVVLLRRGGTGTTRASLEKCSTSLAVSSPIPGSDPSVTSLSAVSSTVAAGQTGSTVVGARLASGDSVNAFDVTVTFDPRIANVVSLCLDDNWRESLAARWDNSGGSLRVAAFRLGTGCAGGSDCPLFKVTWTARQPGRSSLVMSQPMLAGAHDGVAGLLPGVPGESGVLVVQ